MASSSPGAIRARDYGFTYRDSSRPALQGVEVDVEPGQCLLVVGPSGSGKSTFGLAVAGLVPREIPGTVAGSLAVNGRDTTAYEPAELAGAVGLVLQDPTAQVVMDRVEDDVAFGLENRGWTRARMRDRIPEILGQVGLGGFERRHARDLSGGEQQRLALAGVLAPRPGILVLDEPTANLDPDGAAAFIARLAEIRDARAATVVLVEHRVDAAWELADLVLALGADGAPLAVGRPDAVLREAGARMAAAGIWLPDGATEPDADPGIGWPASVGRTVLEAHGLRYGYDPHVPVLRDIDLVAAQGERIAMVGPNGGGKSTLGRLLVGLLKPRHGTVRLAGRDPARLPPAELARLAGFVFQRPEQQFLAQRVADEVSMGLLPNELDTAAELMDRLDLPLETFGERSPYLLSGGEQRRLSMASALVRHPAVLVLDEPTFGQDRLGYEALLVILHDLVQDGTCLIAATHDRRFVRDVASRIVTLDEGWLIADEPAGGTPASEVGE